MGCCGKGPYQATDTDIERLARSYAMEIEAEDRIAAAPAPPAMPTDAPRLGPGPGRLHLLHYTPERDWFRAWVPCAKQHPHDVAAPAPTAARAVTARWFEACAGPDRVSPEDGALLERFIAEALDAPHRGPMTAADAEAIRVVGDTAEWRRALERAKAQGETLAIVNVERLLDGYDAQARRAAQAEQRWHEASLAASGKAVLDPWVEAGGVRADPSLGHLQARISAALDTMREREAEVGRLRDAVWPVIYHVVQEHATHLPGGVPRTMCSRRSCQLVTAAEDALLAAPAPAPEGR